MSPPSSAVYCLLDTRGNRLQTQRLGSWLVWVSSGGQRSKETCMYIGGGLLALIIIILLLIWIF
jgi:hypothetical protein